MNFFKKIFVAVEAEVKNLFGPNGIEHLQAIGHTIDQILPQALTVVEMVNALVPTRTATQLEALAAKYMLHVTPQILADPVQVETLLENAAVRELQDLTKGDVPNSILRTAINFAVNLVKTKVNTGTAPPPVTGTVLPVPPPPPANPAPVPTPAAPVEPPAAETPAPAEEVTAATATPPTL